MGSVNNFNPKIDQTVHIFDSFYNYSANIPAQEYDIVVSFFKSVFKTAEAAENFTTALFRVAEESDTNALTLLQTFEGQNEIELTVTMAYYLNTLRSPATLLGVLNPVTPNYYTARNVRP